MTGDGRTISECRNVAIAGIEPRAIGAYLGLAVGDALGATVEFMTPAEIRADYGIHDRIRGGGWLRLKPGQVTDDTTMSLALGRSILSNSGVDAVAAAEAFSEWMREKPVDIGNTVRRGILHFRTTGTAATAESEHAAGNGACMRSLPVALATFGLDTAAILAASRAQAHITHHNSLSDAAAACIITMVHQGLNGVLLDPMRIGVVRDLVTTYPQFGFDGRRCENPSGYIVDSMRAVFQALFSTNDFKACLLDVVNRGGDADTTGAIAGMIAGAVYGIEAIPDSWLSKLDSQISQDCTQQACALLHLALSRASNELRYAEAPVAQATQAAERFRETNSQLTIFQNAPR